MAMREPEASGAGVDDLSDILDDDPLTEEDLEAVRAWKANPVGVPDEVILADLAARADSLVAMTGGHVRGILEQFPAGPARPRLLDPAGADVADPVGQPLEVYQACAAQLTAHIERLVAEIVPPG